MSVEIWLTFDNRTQCLQLPVNPSEFSVKTGSANETITVQNLGEVSIIQDPVLVTIDFSSHFPKEYGPYCATTNLIAPADAVDMIQVWKDSGRPCRLIVNNDEGVSWNIPVTIESFTVKEMAGDVGSVYYDISLREYRFTQVRQLTAKSAGGKVEVQLNSAKKRTNEQVTPKVHEVRQGQTVQEIGLLYQLDYLAIAQLNNLRPPYNLDGIKKLRLLP
ncbi:hypothetical protein [Brevibacillus dissolubilis]|uniref:hypothetical protein n=1 Tax=Brevibacillus dissolubilis TaxID=1844116 RepID=UPI0011162FD5|nr:hypothetical protein [Brevibacillus dissolubilis]